MSDTIRVSRELLLRAADQLERFMGDIRSGTSDELRAILSQPAEQQCKTCGGTCCVPDGTITHHEDGTPFVNGPIKVVKNCPDCTAEQQDESWQAGYDKGRQDGANRRPDDVKQLELRNIELQSELNEARTSIAHLLIEMDAKERSRKWNQTIRDSLISLLKQAGFTDDSTAINHLESMHISLTDEGKA